MPVAVLGGAPGYSIYTDSGGFVIPKAGSTGHPILEDRWTETDHQINRMGHLGEGVTRGCRVTAQSTPTFAINVASGTVQLRGVSVSVAAVVALPNPPHPTLDRIDVVAVHKLSSGAGHVELIPGTPSGIAYPPLLPSGYLGIAFVLVQAGAAAIRAAEIVDKRVKLVAPIVPSAVLSTDLEGVTLSGFSSLLSPFIVVPMAGTIRNLYIRTYTAQAVGDPLSITVQKNGVSTALSVTIPAAAPAGIFSEVANTVTVAAGDYLDLALSNFSGTSAAVGAVVVEIDP